MELQQLRYVVALSRELNFQRASKKLHVTQPTLSQQLKKLEDEIGITLFERSPKYVRLTSAGEKFVPFALELLERLERGLEEIREDKGEVSGHLKIGAIPTIGPFVLPPLVQASHQAAPKLKLELFEEITPVLIEKLKQGQLDLGILSLPFDETALAVKNIGKETFLLAVPLAHELAKRKQISLQDLNGQRLLILQEGHCFSEQALSFCRRSREDRQVVFQGSSLQSVLNLAAAGEGITFLPKMAEKSCRNLPLKLIPFGPKAPMRQIVVIWRLAAPLNRNHRFMIQLIQDTYERTFK